MTNSSCTHLQLEGFLLVVEQQLSHVPSLLEVGLEVHTSSERDHLLHTAKGLVPDLHPPLSALHRSKEQTSNTIIHKQTTIGVTF